MLIKFKQYDKIELNKLQATQIQAKQIKTNDANINNLIIEKNLIIDNKIVKKIIENATLEELQYIISQGINKSKNIYTKSQQILYEENVINLKKELLVPSYSCIIKLKSVEILPIPESYNDYFLHIDIKSIEYLVHSNFTSNDYNIIQKSNFARYNSDQIDFSIFCVNAGLFGTGILHLLTKNNTYLINMIDQQNNIIRLRLLDNLTDNKIERKLFEHNVEIQLEEEEFENKFIKIIIPKSIYNSIFSVAVTVGRLIAAFVGETLSEDVLTSAPRLITRLFRLGYRSVRGNTFNFTEEQEENIQYITKMPKNVRSTFTKFIEDVRNINSPSSFGSQSFRLGRFLATQLAKEVDNQVLTIPRFIYKSVGKTFRFFKGRYIKNDRPIIKETKEKTTFKSKRTIFTPVLSIYSTASLPSDIKSIISVVKKLEEKPLNIQGLANNYLNLINKLQSSNSTLNNSLQPEIATVLLQNFTNSSDIVNLL